MNQYQKSALIIIVLFYLIYFVKMYLQSRKGIKTNQMGVGEKSKKAVKVEKILRIITALIVPVEIISILFDTRGFESNTFRTTGVLLGAVGVIIFFLAVFTMRDNWRAGIPSEDKTSIVTKGIYRISRNPAFLGFDLIYIGLFLTFANIVHLIFVIGVVYMMHQQILEEEFFLPTVFGEEYMKYKDRVGRYFIFF